MIQVRTCSNSHSKLRHRARSWSQRMHHSRIYKPRYVFFRGAAIVGCPGYDCGVQQGAYTPSLSLGVFSSDFSENCRKRLSYRPVRLFDRGAAPSKSRRGETPLAEVVMGRCRSNVGRQYWCTYTAIVSRKRYVCQSAVWECRNHDSPKQEKN